ncbi:cobyric acid synthase, partial [bacterium]|nr:cobyric acid synthase [bacterium]
MKKLKPIMFVGTGSDVGKSVINTGFCRIFHNDGFSPAPFKAQNMSLNSYATPEGLEIGRAQAVQAEACNIMCSVNMNPVLLKPTDNLSSQVVLNGKPVGNQTASEYFLKTDREMLFREAMSAFNKLAGKHNPIVIEGAGSISEINLWDKDITNMRVALETGASTYLVADIDKGGIFASVYGTISLLPPEQRALIKGIIINKFRGDIELFYDGKEILKQLTHKPVVGVVPYFRDIFIEQEDSVVLEQKSGSPVSGKVNVAVVLLKHIANFTDFDLLEQIPEVNLFYTNKQEFIKEADILIIPGSKNTISDLIHLKDTGLDSVIKEVHLKGKPVYGICGGFQMMGNEINDPHQVEGSTGSIKGLSILPVSTTILHEKITEQC